MLEQGISPDPGLGTGGLDTVHDAAHILPVELAGALVLLDIDARWPGYEAMDSYFVHNFATDPALNGVGSMMLEEAELLSAKQGKKYLRLDCPIHNNYLNDFYESRGYIKKGRCVDGAYTGILREKKL